MKRSRAVWTSVGLVAATVSITACGLLGGNPAPVLITRATYGAYGADYSGMSFGHTVQYFDNRATETDFGLQYFVRTEVLPVGESLEATFVLDSVILFEGATGGISSAQVDSARGATFHAKLASNGRLTDFSNRDVDGGLSTELADRVLKTFFPIIPDNGAESGAAWTDTLDTHVVVNGLDNDIHIISEHSATGWVLHGGERALHILTVSNYTFNGSGTQSGRDFTVDGSGRRHIHRYLSADGRYLGLVSADTSNGEARLIEMDMVIPIHQTRIDSLSIR